MTSTRFIYYSKVADTLRDLAQLDIPIANLYDRYQVQPSHQLPQEDPRDCIFSFKDPRLMHFNSTFARASLTSTSGLERFARDPVPLV